MDCASEQRNYGREAQFMQTSIVIWAIASLHRETCLTSTEAGRLNYCMEFEPSIWLGEDRRYSTS